MVMRCGKFVVVMTLMLVPFSVPMWADDDPSVVRVATRFGSHPLSELPISVIRLGLANAPQPRALEIAHLPQVNQLRILSMLENGSADFDLYFSGHTEERAQQLRQIPFPLTQGLLGLRVLVVPEDTPAVETLDQLKQQWIMGSGLNWLDTDILQSNGFRVFESEYANLWPMLARRRFTAFPRGVAEAFAEIEQQAKQGRSFHISPDWLLAYPADYFVYLNRDDEELALQLEAGLITAQANGALDELYRTHPAITEAREWLDHNGYQLIWLVNPLMDGQLPNIPQRYWIPAHHFNKMQ
ncbi:hypothetical protein BGP77_14845 [Saccharospirillum sp. MSK14-1]|uniref:hypothetical protein n=1 Tax=Saccharospirillum sp. MSK14-1 TaxID=1897632 RepID=UPI000D3881F5|nr:hypothetical protein [Saccharospirillum sp. MSK14-1]PTY37755.1 hypothetical protein BGP77_14845 [Saccharospirillum sp. MSK14-1]